MEKTLKMKKTFRTVKFYKFFSFLSKLFFFLNFHLNDYRPILILPILRSFFKKVVFKQVYTGPRKGNPGPSTFRKIRAPLPIPAPYARKPGGGGGKWGYGPLQAHRDLQGV